MKKIGCAAIICMIMISCGSANDGNPNTDTTHFNSAVQDSGHTDIGVIKDSNNRAPGGTGSSGTTTPSRSTTPGNQNRDTVRQ